MDKTINIVPHDKCTGCGACYNKCPVSAIEMQADFEGFLFPFINAEKCVNCGLCLKVCPVDTPKYENAQAPDCYAVMASDEIREKSSSGGVFTLLAEWMLDQGGVVCGAAYTDDCYGVEHIIATNRDELHKLRGSKYVQSHTGQIYRQVQTYLEQGTPVLFTGTPCQVAAVQSYLGKPHQNLYTLDLVCHGVPSPAVFRKFIKEQEEKHNSKAVRVSFRDKSVVQWNHCIKIHFQNGDSYQKKRNDCAYLRSFLQLLSVRKSCGSCPFAKLPRQGDLTIADFWDIDKFNPKYDDRKGTSLVLANNNKGNALLAVLKESSDLCEQAPLEHGIKHNAQIKYSSLLHPHRSRFYDLLSTYQYDFEKAVDYGLNRKFDIGYIGWWYGANYGSVLTNYALHSVLTQMGKSVLMLEWPVLSDEIPARKPNNKTRRFANHFYEQSMMTKLSDFHRFNYHCNSFLVGSDQLWNWWSNRDVGSYFFFLDFVDDAHKKIAYSTSFGHDHVHYPEEMRLKIGYLLQRFDAISVREKSGVTVCKRDFDVDAVQTMDPVFLCSMEAYERAIALSNATVEDQYVLAYILNPTEEKIRSVRHTAQQMNLPYHIILDGQEDFEKLKQQANDPNVLENVEIADWLKYIKYATYVITDSFHGFCYSVIFQRNLSVFPNQLRGLARFESLSQITGLEDRLLYSHDDLVQKEPWKHPIDYSKVVARMKPQIEYSVQWLKNALAMEKLPPSTKELELKQLMEVKDKLSQLESQNKTLNKQMDILTSKPVESEEPVKQHHFAVKDKVKNLLRPFYRKAKQVLLKLKWKIFRK